MGGNRYSEEYSRDLHILSTRVALWSFCIKPSVYSTPSVSCNRGHTCCTKSCQNYRGLADQLSDGLPVCTLVISVYY